MPTVLDAIKRLGATFHGEHILPGGRTQVQLRFEGTRFAVVGSTADEIFEAAALRIGELMAEKQGMSREVGKLVAEQWLAKIRKPKQGKDGAE